MCRGAYFDELAQLQQHYLQQHSSDPEEDEEVSLLYQMEPKTLSLFSRPPSLSLILYFYPLPPFYLSLSLSLPLISLSLYLDKLEENTTDPCFTLSLLKL